jgi:F0F1-type ATP synthase membrane subunit a
MTLRRLLANLLAGIVLVVILIGLVIIMVDEKCSKHVSANVRERWTQDIPFAGDKK